MSSFFETPIEFIKGVGPQRAALFQKELKVFTIADLLQHYPFRYEDRTRFYAVREVTEEMQYVQVVGKILRFDTAGSRNKKRLVGTFTDGAGTLELVWFQGINWVLQKIKPGVEYVVFGKPNRFGRTLSIAHPEVDVIGASEKKGAEKLIAGTTGPAKTNNFNLNVELKQDGGAQVVTPDASKPPATAPPK